MSGVITSTYYLRNFICNLLNNTRIREFTGRFQDLHPSLFSPKLVQWKYSHLKLYSNYCILTETNKFGISFIYSATRISAYGLNNLGTEVSNHPSSQYFPVLSSPTCSALLHTED